MPCADASFHVLGSPFSLLGVNLSPSQTLYTRRGTLVALTGKAENVGDPLCGVNWPVLTILGRLDAFAAFSDPGRLVGPAVPVSEDILDFADNRCRGHKRCFVVVRDDPS
jgi:hypothetical protein